MISEPSRVRSGYGGVSPNDFPLYMVRDGSRFLRVPTATLRSWFVGTNQGAFPPVLEPAGTGPLRLSFNNLAEAFVLQSLRRDHAVRLSDIRAALTDAERELNIHRVLLRRDLKTHAGQLLIEKFGNYLTLGPSRQYAMKAMLDAALARFEWEEDAFPAALFPPMPTLDLPDRVIAISPKKSFGLPYLVKKGISTAVVALRFDTGESIDEIAEDYDLPVRDVSAAIVYEEAA